MIKFLRRLVLALTRRGFFNFLDDKHYLQIQWWGHFGYKLNLKNPKTFNEKMQWLKLYDRKPEYSDMVDKYEAKKYVADRIGEEYIIPNYGVWDSFEEIDFSELPDKFVLKCTHDCGGLVICKNKAELDIESAKEKINASLGRNYYMHCREWPYKNVKPRIIAEEYIEPGDDGDLLDYKLMCFGGKVHITFVCSGRNNDHGLHMTIYDREWNKLKLERHYPSEKKDFPKPENYEKMVEFAEKLSAGVPFLRVDFYNINGRIYFGELTFFPDGGMEKFDPESWDYELGNLIPIP
ncbi:MAG: ATP-grasp fold amidoligase family protein [Clostridia bacterium]|nr:ATP-grasp fold amidoligase family protein [Clostridia bacterium]